mmetsp:Transcript_75036/g.67425  ORF Transcript_75036/g.67425 Transcript_75036/m.67425 type:complete len:163 (+) Transcript_75036:87-575(+)
MNNMDELNLDTNNNEDMEAKLRRLSRKLSTANVFSDEYKRLQFELDALMQQQGIDDDDYYEEMDENKYSEYNDKTMVYKKQQQQEQQQQQQQDPNPFVASDFDLDVMDDDEKELKSLCTLSRRSTSNVRKTNRKERNDDNDKYRHHTRRRESASASGMEIVD